MTTLTATEAAEFRVLEYLYDAPGRSSSQETSLAPINEAVGDETVQAAVRALKSAGHLYEGDEGLAGDAGAILTAKGAAAVEGIRRKRSDLPARNRAVRVALLRWLYSEELRTRHNTYINLFSEADENTFYGAPFTDDEINAASLWLRDRGMVKGPSALGTGVLRPRITTEGMVAVEQGIDINAPSHGSQGLSIHGNVTGNVMMASPGATQHYTVTNELGREIGNALDAVSQALVALHLGAAVQAELLDLIREGRNTEPRSNPGRLRTLLATVQDKVLTSGSNALAQVVVAEFPRLIERLGEIAGGA